MTSETAEEVEADLEALEAEIGSLTARRDEVDARIEEFGPEEERDSDPAVPPSPVAGAARAMLRRIAMWQLVPLILVYQFLPEAHHPWDYLRILSLTSAAAAAVYGFDRWAAKNPEGARELREMIGRRMPRRWRRKGPKMRVPSPKELEAREKRHRERDRWDQDRKRRRKRRGRR